MLIQNLFFEFFFNQAVMLHTLLNVLLRHTQGKKSYPRDAFWKKQLKYLQLLTKITKINNFSKLLQIFLRLCKHKKDISV